MNKIKFYKPNGRSIEVNDTEGAAEAMIRDGWTLENLDTTKPVVEEQERVNEPEQEKVVKKEPTQARSLRRKN